MSLSVVIITRNEESNIGRTLASVAWADERIVVDSGSTDRTLEVAREQGAKVFAEAWKGYAQQKNSAIAKASGDWTLSIDADEEVSAELAESIKRVVGNATPNVSGYFISRRNLFLGRWIRHGGFYPDRKLRLVQRGKGEFVERAVHETMRVEGPTSVLQGDLIHNAYPTLTAYIETMNRYSSLGAEVLVQKGQVSQSLPSFFWNVRVRPVVNFIWNYLFRAGFLDGREGFLLHLYHHGYVSWKYAKAWEAARAGNKQ
ncbi:MAG TPA: glycosyltransferase family 2 protein [Terriglobales bacterium]|jgi:glycosyltransferase involved in cell wall biosynthesis|nr:glycosyltransferase family 2 protein [Terriglobales bacterium]